HASAKKIDRTADQGVCGDRHTAKSKHHDAAEQNCDPDGCHQADERWFTDKLPHDDEINDARHCKTSNSSGDENGRPVISTSDQRRNKERKQNCDMALSQAHDSACLVDE